MDLGIQYLLAMAAELSAMILAAELPALILVVRILSDLSIMMLVNVSVVMP